jgi:hypothetical protein
MGDGDAEVGVDHVIDERGGVDQNDLAVEALGVGEREG